MKIKMNYLLIIKYFAVIFLIALLLSSCRTYYRVSVEPAYNRDFKGASYKEIVNKMGAPDRTEDDGDGGRIVIYEEYTNYSTSTGYAANANNRNQLGERYSYGASSSVGRSVKTSYIEFFIDGDTNRCYRVRTNHYKIESKPDVAGTIVGSIAVSVFLIGLLLLYAAT